MKLKKQNVIYRVEDPEKIQELKNKGFKEVKAKSKLTLNDKDDEDRDPKKEDKNK